MSIKRSVILRGEPLVDEQGTASAQVKPGYFVNGVTSIAHSAEAAGTDIPRIVALERDELGAGIDNANQGQGTVSAFYASGDRVKTAALRPGDEVTAFIASGYGVAVNDRLMSHGDGTLRPLEGSNTRIAVAMEAVTGSVSVPALRVRIM
jgi:hypothetical protein